MDGTWAGVAVAFLAGLAGVIIGVFGQLKAKKANDLAKVANGIAADALREAAEANRVAVHANELSEEANTIALRVAQNLDEDWFVEWAVEWETEGAVLTLVNRGKDTAFQMSVVVAGQDVHQVWNELSNTAAGEHQRFALKEIDKQRAEYNRKNWGSDTIHNGYVPAVYRCDLTITVRWKTGLGFPQSQKLELRAN